LVLRRRRIISSRPETDRPSGAATASANNDRSGRGSLDLNVYFSNEFANQIRTQRTNLLIAGGFAFAVLAISVLSAWYLFRTNNFGGTPIEYMKLGPAAISTITLPFPIRMFLTYRMRIPIYAGYKRLFDAAAATGAEVQPALVEDARAALKALHKVE
jgi:hypothetical protein